MSRGAIKMTQNSGGEYPYQAGLREYRIRGLNVKLFGRPTAVEAKANIPPESLLEKEMQPNILKIEK